MKKEKGFTLVELLAVIVILAVLVLLAVPSVIKMLDNTKKNAFAVEAENIIKAGKNAYASEMLDGTFENGCYSLEKLSQYTDKNFEGYTGSVYIDSENNNDKVWLGNGNYIIAGSYSGNMVVTKLTSERPAPNNCDDMFVVTDPSGEGETATTVQELLDRIDALETELETADAKITILETELNTFKKDYENHNTNSTTEHWTGKYWLNGKKLYSKTFVYTWSSAYDTGIASASVDAIYIVGNSYCDGGVQVLPVNWPYGNDPSKSNGLSFNKYVNGNVFLEFRGRIGTTSTFSCYVTLEYTKTSET